MAIQQIERDALLTLAINLASMRSRAI